MEADELLNTAVKVLAEARGELLSSCQELKAQFRYSTASLVEDTVKKIDHLTTAIRIYQLPK